jgi:hypothetical protein
MLAQPTALTKAAAASHAILTMLCITLSFGSRFVVLSALRPLHQCVPGEPLPIEANQPRYRMFEAAAASIYPGEYES